MNVPAAEQTAQAAPPAVATSPAAGAVQPVSEPAPSESAAAVRLSGTAKSADQPSVPSHISIPALALQDTREQRIGRTLLLLALCSGLGLMWSALAAGPLVLDECGTYWLAGRGQPLTIWERSLNYENIPPLAPLMHRAFLDILGKSEFALRLPSVVCFLLTILVSYWLGRDLVGPIVGGLTALTVAWHPNALGEVRIARCYSLTLLLSALLFWLTLQWCSNAHQRRFAISWSLVAAALLWTHYLNLAVVMACLAVLAWELRTETMTDRLVLLLSVIAVAASGMPLLAPLLRMSIWGESFGFQDETPLTELITPLWWLGFPVAWLMAWLLDRCWFHRGGSRTIRIPRQYLRLLMFWGWLPILGAAVVCHGTLASLANPRYRIGFEVAAACLLVVAVCRRRTPAAGSIAVTLALLLAWAVAERYPWVPKRLNTRQSHQWKALALHVQHNGSAAEPLFVQSGLGEGFLLTDLFDDPVLMDFAACRMGRFYLPHEHPRYALPFFWQPGTPVFNFFVGLLDSIRTSAVPSLWIAAATDTDLNLESLQGFQRLLKSHGFEPVETVTHPDCVLLHYRARPQPDTAPVQ